MPTAAIVTIALILLASVVVLLVLRRSGRATDLVADQMKTRLPTRAGHPGLDAAKRDEVENLVRQGDPLQAVMLLRRYCGMTLLAAKRAVDHAHATGRLPSEIGPRTDPRPATPGPTKAQNARERELARLSSAMHALKDRRERESRALPPSFGTPVDRLFHDPLGEPSPTGRPHNGRNVTGEHL
ncbi:MAG TPA: hypothetical protein VK453_02595 [Micromonosporaceae bacterium]|nr:hypothetical protein [Micromonosporaceae bacterium]